MNIPEFTAEASLYRTNNRYRSSGSESSDLLSGKSIMLAYNPGPAAQAACDKCTNSVVGDYFDCIASVGFPLTLVSCTLGAWWDAVTCVVDDCCPKRCGPPDFFDLAGSGCCDAEDTCVAKNDPNSRHGCCPSDQNVCSGKCCAKGESCCGDTCCPPNYFCRDGIFCESEFIGDFPNTPPPPPPINNCIFGGAPCGSKCCPPGLECCGVFNGQPDCKTSCLR